MLCHPCFVCLRPQMWFQNEASLGRRPLNHPGSHKNPIAAAERSHWENPLYPIGFVSRPGKITRRFKQACEAREKKKIAQWLDRYLPRYVVDPCALAPQSNQAQFQSICIWMVWGCERLQFLVPSTAVQIVGKLRFLDHLLLSLASSQIAWRWLKKKIQLYVCNNVTERMEKNIENVRLHVIKD
jgi:hypothetical protein